MISCFYIPMRLQKAATPPSRRHYITGGRVCNFLQKKYFGTQTVTIEARNDLFKFQRFP